MLQPGKGGIVSQDVAFLRVVIQGVDQNLSSVLDRVERQIATTASAAGKAEQVFRNMVGAFGVQQLVQGGVELAQLGGQALTTSTRFDQLATSAGQSGDAILNALRKASGGEISDLNLQLTANRSNLLEVATTADQFSTLMAIARDRAQQLGGSTTAAFNDLVTGLGRGSAEILDNLGIMVRLEEVNGRYAASLGKTVSALTAAEKKQALINAVLEQGRASLAATGGAVDGPASAFERLGVAAENAKTKIGEMIATAAAAPAGGLASFVDGIAEGLGKFTQLGGQQQAITTQIVAGATSYDQYTAALARTNEEIAKQTTVTEFLSAKLPQLSQQQFALAQSLQAQGASSAQAVAQVTEYGNRLAALGSAQQAYVTSQVAQGTSLQAALAAAEPLGRVLSDISAVERDLIATNTGTAASASDLAARMTTLAATSGPVAAQVADLARAYREGAVDAEQLGATLQQLEAAQALVVTQSEANGAAMAAQANATREATVAVDAQTQAIGAQLVSTQAAEEKARLLAEANALIASLGGEVASGLLTISAAAATLAAQYGITEAAARSLIAAQAGVATQQRFADQRSAREQRNAGGGPQTASRSANAFVAQAQKDAVAAQDAREKAERRTTARAGGGGGGGGVAAKVATAQRAANNQTEDLEQKHQDKLTQIEADAMQKRMQAEQAFHQSQTRGRIGFYAGLANVTDAAAQKALAARYEAIQQEANAIKQSQGADVAQAYAAAAEKALQQQSQLEQQIADAKKSKDPAKAEFLTGILAMQKAADDEELAAIKAKGSAIEAERQKQYANEEADFAAHLDRIGTVYERKTAALPGLKTALGSGGGGALPSPASVAQAQAGGPGVPTSAAPTKSGAQPVEDVSTPPAVDALGGLLGGKLDGLGGKLDAIVGRLSAVEGAVRDLKRNGAFGGA